MASCDNRHKVPENGVACCSRPMWSGGLPADFCNEPAYGPQEKDQRRSGEYLQGRWCASYVPFWACYAHGGPKEPADASVDRTA